LADWLFAIAEMPDVEIVDVFNSKTENGNVAKIRKISILSL
jgi:hypothetical protein